MPTNTNGHTWTEHFKIDGDRLVGEIKRLISEGNVRRISIRQGEHTIAEFPLTIGVAGAVVAPWLAAAGAIAALVTDSSIVVERVGQPGASHRATSTVDSPVDSSASRSDSRLS